MKIAIQRHPTRGKEIIQILESLGGINTNGYYGNANGEFYYYINAYNKITYDSINLINLYGCKLYTLEEFEKEFPFKIGDKVIYSYTPNFVGTIVDIKFDDNIPYRVDIEGTICTCGTSMLKPYKEMKKERNITLTLNKAKEWYKKGGELKEVALQAYSEEELTKVELPKTWEEFCENYPVKEGESWLGVQDSINISIDNLLKRKYKNWIPSKKSAEAHLALMQLEQLRDCYRQGDIPDFTNIHVKYCIVKVTDRIDIVKSSYVSHFLSFTRKEVAYEFLNNFKPLIKIAEDYI